ncbi:unnamed protein product [Arctia plantaginis]|uniref:Uncharacterized protein n=1 Tax=Arctia plantaginis TaxID=874455 RepID=A0A8S1AZV4_ARCPL|nr:unnamed protein product [Arctia plantaginis]
MFKAVLLLTFVILVSSQVEQSVFAQFSKPQTHKVQVQPPTTKAVGYMALPHLSVLRSRRSFFDRDMDPEDNNALLLRMKQKMSNPNWVPDIRPRNNFFN